MKSSPDNSFCLNAFRFGGKLDLVTFSLGLTSIFCLFECNLDFISVFGIYYVENTLISYNCKYVLVYVLKKFYISHSFYERTTTRMIVSIPKYKSIYP